MRSSGRTKQEGRKEAQPEKQYVTFFLIVLYLLHYNMGTSIIKKMIVLKRNLKDMRKLRIHEIAR